MSIEEEGTYILGINEEGKRFRPSDWVERIATALGRFDANHRIHYNPMVLPTSYEGQKSLFVADRLAELDSEAYHFIMQFAHSNRLQMLSSQQPELQVA